MYGKMLCKLALVLVLPVLMLCACTPAEAPEKTEPSETETTLATQATPVEMPECYDALLQALVSAFPWDAQAGTLLSEYPDLGNMYSRHGSLAEVGYAVADVDGNGQPELLLASMDSPFVYDAYTVQDGKLTQVFSSGEWDSRRLYEDRYLENQWASETGASGTDYFRITDGKLELLDRVVMDPEYALQTGRIESLENPDTNQCFFRSSGESREDYQPITALEAVGIQQTFKEDHIQMILKYTALSDYGK